MLTTILTGFSVPRKNGVGNQFQNCETVFGLETSSESKNRFQIRKPIPGLKASSWSRNQNPFWGETIDFHSDLGSWENAFQESRFLAALVYCLYGWFKDELYRKKGTRKTVKNAADTLCIDKTENA